MWTRAQTTRREWEEGLTQSTLPKKCSTEKWKGATMQSSTTFDHQEPKPVIYKAAIVSKIFRVALIGIIAPSRIQGFWDYCPR